MIDIIKHVRLYKDTDAQNETLTFDIQYDIL